MEIGKKEVEHVARLARLALSEAEKENLASQLSNILEHMEQLRRLDTRDVPPCSHPFASRTAWREDQSLPKSDGEAILANAPEREESFFKVNKVIE